VAALRRIDSCELLLLRCLTESRQVLPDATLEEYVPKLAAYHQQTECLHPPASAFSKPAGGVCCFPNLTEDAPSIMGKIVLIII
jgi:hypothetical protein